MAIKENFKELALEAKQIQVALARKSINHFAEYCFHDAETRLPLSQGQVHMDAQKHIDTHSLSLIIFPRNHGKTEQFVIIRALWELGHRPDLRIKIVCQGDEPAADRLQALKEHLMENPRLREVFPKLRPAYRKRWDRTKIIVQRKIISKDVSVEALGILSTATGGRADLILFDDPVDFRNAIQNPALRPVVKSAFFEVWMNLLEPTGRVIYVATPWHVDDLTHELKKMPIYGLFYRAIDDDYNPVWPEKWDSSRLKAHEEKIKSRAFARGFKCVAISDEEATFPDYILNQLKDYTMGPDEIDPSWLTFTGVDLSLGKKETKEASDTVIFTIALHPDGYRIVKEIIVGRFGSPETAARLNQSYRRHHQQVILVENNAYQDALLQWMQACGYHDLPLDSFHTGKQKFDEHIGVPSLAVEMQNGLWRLPMGKEPHPVDCPCTFCLFLKQLSEFPVGQASDIVMAGWFAKEAISSTDRKYGGFSRLNLYKHAKIPDNFERVVAISHGNPDCVRVLWGALSPENRWFIYDYWGAATKSISEVAKVIIAKSYGQETKCYLLDAIAFEGQEEGKHNLAHLYMQQEIPVMEAPYDFRVNADLVRVGLESRIKDQPQIMIADHLVDLIGEINSTFYKIKEKNEENPYLGRSTYLNCLEFMMGLQLSYTEPKEKEKYMPANSKTGW